MEATQDSTWCVQLDHGKVIEMSIYKGKFILSSLLGSVWTNSKFWPNRIPEYYSYAMFDRIEYTNNSDLIIRIIRIIRNTFERLKLGQIMPKKARNSSVSDNVCIR